MEKEKNTKRKNSIGEKKFTQKTGQNKVKNCKKSAVWTEQLKATNKLCERQCVDLC
jgi:hypothetical protein